MKKTIFISGMHCEHCVSRVESALSEFDGAKVKVNLKKGIAELKSDNEISDDAIKDKINALGFEVTSVE